MANDELIFPVPDAFRRHAWIGEWSYRRDDERSLRDPRHFWAEQADAELHAEVCRAASLPKTRSGKIMRRVLRKIAADDIADLGDTSTLADAAMIDGLVSGRRAIASAAR
jgi:acyl-coenzyme A synthetase/AMP-(fatty) acid ligase